MTAQDLGSIDEIVGGLGVMVTLAYLAVQIRQGSPATRSFIRQEIAAHQIAYIDSRATDAVHRAVLRKAGIGEALSPYEQQALNTHAVAAARAPSATDTVQQAVPTCGSLSKGNSSTSATRSADGRRG